MTRAAGMYNTLLRSDDPALVVEVLNGYRIREKLPTNLGEFTVPLGVTVPVIAWGLGLDRMAMVALGIQDIRDLFTSDLDAVRNMRRNI